MSDIADYKEKFLAAEKRALDLVSHLETLKNESGNYKNATVSLNEVNGKILELISNMSKVVSEEENLISTIKEIGTDKIIEKIEQNKISIEEKIQIQEKMISKLNRNVNVAIGLISLTCVIVIILLLVQFFI